MVYKLSIFQALVFAALIFTSAASVYCQTVIDFKQPPVPNNITVQKAVDYYSKAEISEIQKNLKGVSSDTTFEAAFAGLPADWRKISSFAPADNSDLSEFARTIFRTAGGVNYKVVVIEHDSPLAANDSNCLLIVTRGFLKLGKTNISGIAGVFFHEIAHSLFSRESLETKLNFNSALKNKNWKEMEAARENLALIEIKCDLIASRFLQLSGLLPEKYGDFLELLEQFDTSEHNPYFHPSAKLRIKAIKSLTEFRNN